MKKILAAVLMFCAIISLGIYVYAQETESNSKTQSEYKLNFENTKLIDSKIQPETGVKIEVYTLEDYGNK